MINIKKNSKTYIPYILSCILNISMFYIVYSLSNNKGIDAMIGAETIRFFLQMGIVIIALFSFIFLFYTQSFLIKKRTKEFGLFNILGMEKRHVLTIVALEFVIIAIVSLIIGIGMGIVLDKVMFLCVGRLFSAPVTLGFYISKSAMIVTSVLFITIFIMTYLKTRRIIQLSHPIELLRHSHEGEKEPKTKWLITIIGIITLGLGYYIALTTKNPLSALGMFFIAVTLVIIGTYCLFSAGSITLLKMLKKKKSYYYQSQHFINVSSMISRMKQNVIGLANICILCTMVLIMVSSTVSMWVGIEDIIVVRYPKEILISVENPQDNTLDQVDALTDQVLEDYQAPKKNVLQYTYLVFSAKREQNTYSTDFSHAHMSDADKIESLFFITLDEYEKTTGQTIELQDNEIMLYCNRGSYDFDHLKIFDKDFRIVKKLDDFVGNGTMASNIATCQFIVVKDEKEFKDIAAKQEQAYGKNASHIRLYYGFDTNQSDETNEAIYHHIEQSLSPSMKVSVECRNVERAGAMGLYAGLLFLGIFLSVLFIMAAVLIIYYKQMSEGYEDKERFEIMQKVGMSQSLVKKSIHSQVLTVFLLPPLVAGIHVIFAFPFISKILEVLGLINIQLYAISSVICFLIFIVLYAIVYALTAKTYYKIVKWGH